MINEVIKKRVYRHFKGDYYIVEDIATDNESGELYVVYRSLYEEGRLFVRPLKSFTDLVNKEKYPESKQTYRFELQDIKSINPSH